MIGAMWKIQSTADHGTAQTCLEDQERKAVEKEEALGIDTERDGIVL